MPVEANEPEIIGELASKLTGAEFERVEPLTADSRTKDASWMIRFQDAGYIEKSPHLNTIWSDRNGIIWMESVDLVTSVSLVEDFYGEGGLNLLGKLQLWKFAIPVMRSKLRENFPQASEYLETCEKILENIAVRYGVRLELVQEAYRRIFVFRLVFTFTSDKMSMESKLDSIKSGAMILKEAYDQIRAYEEKILQ